MTVTVCPCHSRRAGAEQLRFECTSTSAVGLPSDGLAFTHPIVVQMKPVTSLSSARSRTSRAHLFRLGIIPRGRSMFPKPPPARQLRSIRTNAPHQCRLGCWCIEQWLLYSLLGWLLGSVLLDFLGRAERRRICCSAHISRDVELLHRLVTEEVGLWARSAQ